jgi:phosphatidylglycerophosphate synthase
MVDQIRAVLQPIADWFGSFGTPAPIVQWGHPLMMGIVVFVMGSYTAWAGWRGRTREVGEQKAETLHMHKRLALWMFTFITLGYTGGVLSLVMQDQPIFESYHFWTGGLVIGLLAINGAISFTKFGGDKPALRTTHAYLGTAALAIMFVHAFLGLKLGLSIRMG